MHQCRLHVLAQEVVEVAIDAIEVGTAGKDVESSPQPPLLVLRLLRSGKGAEQNRELVIRLVRARIYMPRLQHSRHARHASTGNEHETETNTTAAATS